ncbi:MAG: hypothetical protein MSH33_01885 [Fusobacterium necrophorum]|nr:hypothetical protein [Fusobacterium necrophorum]
MYLNESCCGNLFITSVYVDEECECCGDRYGTVFAFSFPEELLLNLKKENYTEEAIEEVFKDVDGFLGNRTYTKWLQKKCE